MQSFTLFLLPFAALLTLVAGNACVIGGPAGDVTDASKCCSRIAGNNKFFSGSPNQGICVLPAAAQNTYEACVKYFTDDTYDFRCITCDETTNCGLEPTS
ncbi:MAG: hypothetical protein M1820_004343 [Bogoriella megaspora]|nr:MAG: hypothetical protein M1820_004343 [Bogoriella megaspora]